MVEVPRHWKEWTRFSLRELRPDLTLAGFSFTVGEIIAEDVSHGATEFVVKVEKDRITVVCNKGDLDKPTGYEPDKLYKTLFPPPF